MENLTREQWLAEWEKVNEALRVHPEDPAALLRREELERIRPAEVPSKTSDETLKAIIGDLGIDRTRVDRIKALDAASREWLWQQADIRAVNKSGSFTADAFLVKEKTFTADAVLVREGAVPLRNEVSELSASERAELKEVVKRELVEDEIVAGFSEHEQKLWAAIRTRKQREEYCLDLHSRGATPPTQWERDLPPCPGTYPEAYKHPHWREEITREKNRLKEKVKRAVEKYRSAHPIGKK